MAENNNKDTINELGVKAQLEKMIPKASNFFIVTKDDGIYYLAFTFKEPGDDRQNVVIERIMLTENGVNKLIDLLEKVRDTKVEDKKDKD